jgi:cytidylate kinase
MIRTITIAREYGSGGAQIGALVAKRLGWRFLDRALIEEIGRAADVDTATAQAYDERVESWVEQLLRALAKGALVEGAGSPAAARLFNSERLVAFAGRLIVEAAVLGSCVIIGRGGQCLLQEREDTLHVFIYAPWPERVARARQRVAADADVEATIREIDRQRAAFIRKFFQQDWQNPHLYDLMISSTLGEEAVCATILCAMGAAGAHAVAPRHQTPGRLSCGTRPFLPSENRRRRFLERERENSHRDELG